MFNTDIALAKAHIRHRRFSPKAHDFQYGLSYLCINIEKFNSVCKNSWLWSNNRFNFISLYEKDYLRSPSGVIAKNSSQLYQHVLEHIYKNFNRKPNSPEIQLITLPRYFGRIFNPVSFYLVYEFNSSSEKVLNFIIADITNTPWLEHHVYCFECKSDTEKTTTNSVQQFEFGKDFHVSPFMPMNIHYDWRFKITPQQSVIHMRLLDEQKQHCIFDATMNFTIAPLSKNAMRTFPLRYPIQTIKVLWGIYWQALRLKLKKIPFYPHPHSTKS